MQNTLQCIRHKTKDDSYYNKESHIHFIQSLTHWLCRFCLPLNTLSVALLCVIETHFGEFGIGECTQTANALLGTRLIRLDWGNGKPLVLIYYRIKSYKMYHQETYWSHKFEWFLYRLRRAQECVTGQRLTNGPRRQQRETHARAGCRSSVRWQRRYTLCTHCWHKRERNKVKKWETKR